jgi:hypothetical protein
MSGWIKENCTTGLTWSVVAARPYFQIQFITTLGVMLGLGFFFPWYFDFLESRNGPVINDWILNLIPATDVSWFTFFFLYMGLLIGVACNFFRPFHLLIAMQTYVLVTAMRIVTLYFFSLNPPAGYIELKDTVMSLFFTNDGRICSKDLFFSGHVSTILSVYFSVQQRAWKNGILLFAIMVGLLVLVQHVHYTIDVLVAPIATYGCYRVSKAILVKLRS